MNPGILSYVASYDVASIICLTLAAGILGVQGRACHKLLKPSFHTFANPRFLNQTQSPTPGGSDGPHIICQDGGWLHFRACFEPI